MNKFEIKTTIFGNKRWISPFQLFKATSTDDQLLMAWVNHYAGLKIKTRIMRDGRFRELWILEEDHRRELKRSLGTDGRKPGNPIR